MFVTRGPLVRARAEGSAVLDRCFVQARVRGVGAVCVHCRGSEFQEVGTCKGSFQGWAQCTSRTEVVLEQIDMGHIQSQRRLC